MKRYLGISFVAFCSLMLVAGLALAKSGQFQQITPVETGEVDMVGDVDGTAPGASKALQDTVWIADWNFDGASCNSTGWTKVDNRIVSDGSNYWSVSNAYAGTGGIVSNAAVLSKHDLCWARDGYGTNWDYSIVLKYRGASTISFDFLSDTEPGFDFITVEVDSAGASESRVNYSVNPKGTPSEFRTAVFTTDGLNSAGVVSALGLTDFGVPATTHEVYIRLSADGGFDDQDGDYASFWNAGLIVDNIAITGALTYSENFEGALNANVTLVNTSASTPFGEWARLFLRVTDNDKCTENTTCSWLWTDPTKIAFFPDMAFGPGSAVIRNWLDDIIISPWVSLASTPSATGTVLSFRRFPGNRFSQGKIVQNWSVRAKNKVDNTDTSTLGDSVDCVSPWGHASSWNSLNTFQWLTSVFDMTPFFSPTGTEVQIRLRVSDWQYIASDGPPATLNPGPGPYTDRVRIGRRVLVGPVINPAIDTRTQGQDAFPTVLNAITPGEHHSPDGANRFGSCAFSLGQDLTINAAGPNFVSGDSVTLEQVVDARGAGGIASVTFYGAITSGPHAGKAPAPYTVGANGFFAVAADSTRSSSGIVLANRWHVDLDDTYFRGGDALKYFWVATDNAGGFTSNPVGLTAAPASVAAAEQATAGLYEVNFLPTITWDPAYLARIAADANGDLDPTAGELANSTQKNCILYVQKLNSNRRSGQINRTSFMYTLDRLGYAGDYDVWDVQGYGNTNNQLGSRANVAQCSGYALIIQDDGRSNLSPNLPDGLTLDSEKINQTQWYRNYLAQGLTGLAGTATFWLIGENTAFEKLTNGLITTDLGLTGVVTDQGLSVNPNVEGQGSFTWANGNATSFLGDTFALNGGCPAIRAYDAANAGGTAVVTHKYKAGVTLGSGAVVMNKNSTLKWNTVWMGFPWFDMRTAPGVSPGSPDEEEVLAYKILNAILPLGCQQSLDPTGDDGETIDAIPRVTALHQNVPNPFNPSTTITFDLAEDGPVRLVVYDVAGRIVKTLADAAFPAGRNHAMQWSGLDEQGRRVASGIYFYRLQTARETQTRKMVLLE